MTEITVIRQQITAYRTHTGIAVIVSNLLSSTINTAHGQPFQQPINESPLMHLSNLSVFMV